jgi:Zn-finger nucleic acid-binding protein
MAVRKEVEIDYCPQCRGIWLDRGELDKIIERSANEMQTEINQYSSAYDKHDNHHKDYDDDDDHHGERKHNGGFQNTGNNQNRRKRSFLGDIFDF